MCLRNVTKVVKLKRDRVCYGIVLSNGRIDKSFYLSAALRPIGKSNGGYIKSCSGTPYKAGFHRYLNKKEVKKQTIYWEKDGGYTWTNFRPAQRKYHIPKGTTVTFGIDGSGFHNDEKVVVTPLIYNEEAWKKYKSKNKTT